jgi:hypothetical protein
MVDVPKVAAVRIWTNHPSEGNLWLTLQGHGDHIAFVHTMGKGIELPRKVADSSSRILGICLAEQVGNPFPRHCLAQIGHFMEADTREPLCKRERFLFPELAASDQPQAHAGFPCAVEEASE